MNLAVWLRAAWRDDGKRRAVIQGYAALRENKMVLADIAARGGVFSEADPKIPLEIAEGRRQMALEILRLAEADHGELMRICFEPQGGANRKDRTHA